jgi:hypothetical protein
MTDFDIGPLDRPRRGVSIGAVLIWMILAAAGGAVAWEVYGNEVRSRLGMGREASTARAPPPNSAAPATDETVALIKEMQASQKRSADQLEAVLQLLTSEQATSKTTADAVTALSNKIDALKRPTVTVAKNPAPAAPRKPLPPAVAPNPDPDQPDPAQRAPTPVRP